MRGFLTKRKLQVVLLISVDTIPVFTPCLDNATDCSNFFPLFIELSRGELGPKRFFEDQLFLGKRQNFWEVFYLVRGKNPNLHYKIPAMPSFHDKEISSLTRTGLRANSLPSQHDDHKYALRVIKYTKPSYLQNKKESQSKLEKETIYFISEQECIFFTNVGSFIRILELE